MQPVNKLGNLGNRRIMLSPQVGAKNLKLISAAARNWYSKIQTTFTPDFCSTIDPRVPENRKMIRETLGLMSRILMNCPLTGTDGIPGKRSYYAHPMHFGKKNANLLRKLGNCLDPAAFDPVKIKRILGNVLEMYKLEIRPSSGLIGFNFDARMTPDSTDKLRVSSFSFSCYEGHLNKIKLLAEVTVPLVNLDDDFTLKLDLFSCNISGHDIDMYK
ncbi:MAG: hypothetical protein ABH860_03915 [bacterium]